MISITGGVGYVLAILNGYLDDFYALDLCSFSMYVNYAYLYLTIIKSHRLFNTV